MYEYIYRGTANVEPILVGVKNNSALANNSEAELVSDCGVELGAPTGSSVYNAVSDDGESIFFTALKCSGGPDVNELYARIKGSKTVNISEPSKEDCEVCNTTTGLRDANFVGASADGEKVFFTTEQELLPGQRGLNLYEYDFKNEAGKRIILVSSGFAEPEVTGVVRVSASGQRVYFVAQGILTSKPDASLVAGQQFAHAGADNLYVYDTETGAVNFVATLLTSAEESVLTANETSEQMEIEVQAKRRYEYEVSEALTEILKMLEHGEVSLEEGLELLGEQEAEVGAREQTFLANTIGTRGPSGTLAEDRAVWQTIDDRPAQSTADGQYLAFVSSADLTVGDTSAVPQLFEYDVITEKLVRVSVGPEPGGGNVNVFHDAPQLPVQRFSEVDLPTAEMARTAISADGSEVFFTSAAPLVAIAVSDAPTVFEYTEGHTFPISDGRDSSDTGIDTPTVQLFGIDPSGRDVFFTTESQLVPRDDETQQVLYDAREDGGFSETSPSRECGGEGCRGASAAPPDLLSPSSVAAGDNVVAKVPRLSTPKVKKLTRRQKLVKALHTCTALPKRMRVRCRKEARGRYSKRSETGAAGAMHHDSGSHRVEHRRHR